MFQKTLIGDRLTTQKTQERHNGHQTPYGDFNTLKREDNKHETPYERKVKTLKRENGTGPTPEGDGSSKATTGGCNAPYGDGCITLEATTVHM